MKWLKPDWPVADNIHAAVTLRGDGLSKPPYAHFNLALHVNDNPWHVQQNRQQLITSLNLPSEPLWLEQTHSNKVVQADQVRGLVQADASYSTQANTVCAVLTADCLPLLIANKQGTHIAAVHAGWRGLLAGIITNTVNALNCIDLIVWLAPAIGIHCFKVGTEVRDYFIHKSPLYNNAFKVISQTHYLADIYQLARIELIGLGITHIYGGDYCTVTDEQRFFSYRRDGETGRMATLIWRD